MKTEFRIIAIWGENGRHEGKTLRMSTSTAWEVAKLIHLQNKAA